MSVQLETAGGKLFDISLAQFEDAPDGWSVGMIATGEDSTARSETVLSIGNAKSPVDCDGSFGYYFGGRIRTNVPSNHLQVFRSGTDCLVDIDPEFIDLAAQGEYVLASRLPDGQPLESRVTLYVYGEGNNRHYRIETSPKLPWAGPIDEDAAVAEAGRVFTGYFSMDDVPQILRDQGGYETVSGAIAYPSSRTIGYNAARRGTNIRFIRTASGLRSPVSSFAGAYQTERYPISTASLQFLVHDSGAVHRPSSLNERFMRAAAIMTTEAFCASSNSQLTNGSPLIVVAGAAIDKFSNYRQRQAFSSPQGWLTAMLAHIEGVNGEMRYIFKHDEAAKRVCTLF